MRYTLLEMARLSEFITYLLEQLAPLGEVRARAMFGGFGIYRGDRMFALVAEDALYIKVDEVNRAEFEARGLLPFRYETKGKTNTMSYWQPPAEAMDDREMLCEWARKGVEAADRAAKKKTRGR
ncbi:MAG: TfoX/Sxy family protein [Chthoniobacteraceae bacterium]